MCTGPESIMPRSVRRASDASSAGTTEQPVVDAESKKAESQGIGEANTLQGFTDQGDGTFKHNETGLVWLADPTNIPKQNSMAEAKAWLANLKTGEQGLTDGSKAGDWRLATAANWDLASETRTKLYSNFSIGWKNQERAMGYMGIASPDDRWDGQFDLITWSNGGRDSTSWPAYIWPVRSSGVNTENANHGTQMKLLPRLIRL